jgi:hypothetical protein
MSSKKKDETTFDLLTLLSITVQFFKLPMFADSYKQPQIYNIEFFFAHIATMAN